MKVFDTRNSGGSLVVLGQSLVLPKETLDGTATIHGALRYNSSLNRVEFRSSGNAWNPLASDASTWENWTPTITTTVAAGSGFAYTVVSARYTVLNKLVVATFTATITNLGTGPSASGLVNATMPFVAAYPACGQGSEPGITGHFLQANMSSASNLLTIKKYDGSSPVVLNAQIRATITYEAQ
jgi:hypothetical protein